MSPVTDDVIRAAGALLWRRTLKGYQIAVIHRGRYDGDWTLPKGKLQDCESWRQAALREVREETGFDAVVRDFAGAIAYQPNDKQKVVRFWHMLAQGEPATHLDEEVRKVFWLSPEHAHDRLQYPLEKALIVVWQAPPWEGTRKMLRPFQFLKRRCLRLFHSMSLKRLGHSIRTFEPELKFLIQQQHDRQGTTAYSGWVDCSKSLLETAKGALDE